MNPWAVPGAQFVADTGVLYALVDRSDAWHARVLRWWKSNTRPIVVPVTVLPEVTYLLQKRLGPVAELEFVQAVANGEFATEPVDPDDYERIAQVMDDYKDLPLGFVDASVVAIAERLETREILTTDRHHFGTIRPRHAPGFQLVP
jgi:predicted nucleic acid-binding protein